MKFGKNVEDKRNEELNKIADEINCLPDHAQMFKAIKSLNRNKCNNPSVLDENNQFVKYINEIHKIIHNHFKQKFRNEEVEDVEPFKGDPRSLHRPIDRVEVVNAVKKLNNSKAGGEEGIPGELLKYGSETLADVLTLI